MPIDAAKFAKPPSDRSSTIPFLPSNPHHHLDTPDQIETVDRELRIKPQASLDYRGFTRLEESASTLALAWRRDLPKRSTE